MSMVSTDPIADMLARIRNAIAVRKHEVSMPHSKMKEAVAQLLKDSNFIQSVAVEGEGLNKSLVLTINSPESNAKITEIVRLSTPGRRLYAPAKSIPVVKRGRGLIIVSTSQGLMTGESAKAKKVGGELICKVY